MRKFAVLVTNPEIAQQDTKIQTVSQRMMLLSHHSLCWHFHPLPISQEGFAGARRKDPPISSGPWPGVFCKHQQMELEGPNRAQRADCCCWKWAKEAGKSERLVEPKGLCSFWPTPGYSYAPARQKHWGVCSPSSDDAGASLEKGFSPTIWAKSTGLEGSGGVCVCMCMWTCICAYSPEPSSQAPTLSQPSAAISDRLAAPGFRVRTEHHHPRFLLH